MKLVNELLAASPAARAMEARRLMGTDRMRDYVARLAQDTGQSLAKARADFERCLREMVSVESSAYQTIFDRVLGPAHTRAFTIDVDAPALRRLRQLNERHALIFLPSHRSYADPFIMARTVLDHGLKRSHVLGGDNLSFWPLGPIARHSGSVFLRRSFKGDKVYKATVQAYLGYMVAQRCNLEWYMEGGRSRTGKLRPPKYGLLAYLVDAINEGAVDDVILVPTAITYDQLHEVTAMAQQEASGHKPKEGIRWLVDYVNMQRSWIGNAYVRFGEPMSLAERIKCSEQPGQASNARWLIEKTAFEVFAGINAATPVTSQAMVTLALLAAGNQALTLNQVFQQLHPMLSYAQARSLPTSQVDKLAHHHGVLETLQTLVRTGVVRCFERGIEPVFAIGHGQHAVAAFYRNSAIHWFINRAILELAMWKAAHSGAEDLTKEGKKETFALRDLLKFEFIFSGRQDFRRELLNESDLFDPSWRDRVATREQRLRMIADASFRIAHAVLPTFLEAYYLVAERLASRPCGLPFDESRFLNECMAVGHQYVLQRRLLHPECLSRELFGNALRLAANRGLLDCGGDELLQARAELMRECEAAMQAARALKRLDAAIQRGNVVVEPALENAA